MEPETSYYDSEICAWVVDDKIGVCGKHSEKKILCNACQYEGLDAIRVLSAIRRGFEI